MNRLVRTRMPGGVGGARPKPAPIPMYARHGRELMGCRSFGNQSPVLSFGILLRSSEVDTS